MTVRGFINRMCWTNEKPSNIPEIRWQAMLRWFKNRLNEGLDMEEIADTLS